MLPFLSRAAERPAKKDGGDNDNDEQQQENGKKPSERIPMLVHNGVKDKSCDGTCVEV